MLQLLLISAVAAVRSRRIMRYNVRSPMESMRHGRHTAGRRLVFWQPLTTFDTYSQSLHTNSPQKATVQILIDIDVSNRWAITILPLAKFMESAAFPVISLITLSFGTQCVSVLYCPISAVYALRFCFWASTFLEMESGHNVMNLLCSLLNHTKIFFSFVDHYL